MEILGVFFDLETGGLEMHHPIIQFAAVAVAHDYSETSSVEIKIKFEESLATREALEINHYDPAVWELQAVEPASACSLISGFLESFKTLRLISKRTGRPYSVAKLIGHNAASFDGPRIQKLFKDHNAFLPADPRIRCTVQRALWYFDECGIEPPADYKLETLCRYFDIPTPEGSAHDALVDVRLNIQLAKALRAAEGRIGRAA